MTDLQEKNHLQVLCFPFQKQRVATNRTINVVRLNLSPRLLKQKHFNKTEKQKNSLK